MKKRQVALAAGVALVLIGLAVVVIAVRPPPALRVRCSKVAVLGDGLMVTLEISNRTSQLYGRRPVRLE